MLDIIAIRLAIGPGMHNFCGHQMHKQKFNYHNEPKPAAIRGKTPTKLFQMTFYADAKISQISGETR